MEAPKQEKPRTPMTVGGDKAKLLTLQYSLQYFCTYVYKFKELYPESYNDTKEWLDVVNQAIKDQEFEESLNSK